MGRPGTNVLFSQTFRHYHPGEHVDEVRFSEPVVICACEILELQKPSLCRSTSLTGDSSPQSFSVEIFVRSGGDVRFKRLCHAFVYSAAAPQLQDVQVAVTDHLVLRGTYDSLTLVLYGDLASNIGELSSDHELNLPIPDLLPSEASYNLEDLPEVLHPHKNKIGPPFPPLQYLQLVHIDKENHHVIQKVLQLAGRVGRAPLDIKSLHKVVKSLVSASAALHISESGLSNFPFVDFCPVFTKTPTVEGPEHKQGLNLLVAAKRELQEMHDQLDDKAEKPSEGVQDVQESEEIMGDEPTMKSESCDMVLELILNWIQGSVQISDSVPPVLFPVESLIGGLAATQLLCTDAQECYRFVVAGGVQLLMDVLQHVVGNFSVTTLLALGAVERVSRYAFGCEALLGWWCPDPSVYGEDWESQTTSKGYSVLVNFLLQAQQQSVAQLAARVLQRLRAYELTAAIQSIMETFIEEPTSPARSSFKEDKTLVRATSLLKRLLGLLSSREIPAMEGSSSRLSHWFALDVEDVGTLLTPGSAYGVTVSPSTIRAREDIDQYLLSVVQERRLLPMLVALISAPKLRSSQGQTLYWCTEFIGITEALLLTLLSCRSGILFLASDSEVATALLTGFQSLQELHERDLPPLRHAMALTTAGFLCRPQDIGGLLQTYLSVIGSMDRLVGACKQSEDSLWALWELSAMSRLESGRQALLMVTWFPEVMTLLVGAFHAGPESSPPAPFFGETWRRAALHFAAEILQVVVKDAAASTVASWTPHAMAMQHAVLSATAHMDGSAGISIGGYEDKGGVCSGLLEWLDAAVVYQKKGAVGLLKYVSAILAGMSGILPTTFAFPAADSMDIEATAGDQAVINDTPNLAVPYQGKSPGIESISPLLSYTAIVQMTVAYRILALVSCYPGVAAVLHGEGAMGVVYSVLDQCLTALQTNSSVFDAALDEDMDDDGAVEDLGDHGKDQLLLGLLLPTVLFLSALLQNLQAAVQTYQNTRLVDVLLSLHHWISSQSASYASVPPYAWSGITQDVVTVRQVLASVLVCWPIFGWTPSLLPRLLGIDSLSTISGTTLLPMEPAVTCSVLTLLVDMLPLESPQLCKNKSALFDMYRSLAAGSILGVQSSSAISWHTRSPHSDKLVGALVPHLNQIGEVVAHHATTTCGVLQDLLKLFIIRLACTNLDHGATVVRLILIQIRELSTPGIIGSEKEILMERGIHILAGLALHPVSKLVLIREGVIEVLLQVCAVQSQFLSGEAASSTAEAGSPTMGSSLGIVRAFAALCDPDVSLTVVTSLSRGKDSPSFKDCCSIVSCLLTLVKLLPIGREFEVVLEGFEKLASFRLGRAAVGYISVQRQCRVSGVEEAASNGTASQSKEDKSEDSRDLIFLDTWNRIRIALDSDKCAGLVLTSVIRRFALSAIVLSAAGKSVRGVAALRLLFGLDICPPTEDSDQERKLEPVVSIATLLGQYIIEDGTGSRVSSKDVSCFSSVPAAAIQEAYIILMAMLRILKSPDIGKELRGKSLFGLEDQFAKFSTPCTSPQRVKMLSRISVAAALSSSTKLDSDLEKDIGNLDEFLFQSDKDSEMCGVDSRGKVVWECPTVAQDRPVMGRIQPKRKTFATVEVNRKRHAVESFVAPTALADGIPINSIGISAGRPLPAPATPASLNSRRDTFRQRKPNTSRPPSMHVDDYVARERSEGVTTGSPAPIQRSLSGSGRPPSIHVDEFMARQQERHLSVSSSGVEEQLLSGRIVGFTSVESSRRDISHLVPATCKTLEEEGHVSSTPKEKGDEHQWEELSVAENAAVDPEIGIDLPEVSPVRMSVPSTTADMRLGKTFSSSSSISISMDSLHSVKTPQVADMLLLQSKVTMQTTVARNLAGVVQTQTEEGLQTVSSSGMDHQQGRDLVKIASPTSSFTGTLSASEKNKASVPLHRRTSELQASFMTSSGDRTQALQVQATDQKSSKHYPGTVLQAILRHSSPMFPIKGTADSTTIGKGYTLSEMGPPQLSSDHLLPFDSQPSSLAGLPTGEAVTSMRELDSQNSVHSLSSDKRKLSSTLGQSARQPDEPSRVLNTYEHQVSSFLQSSPFATAVHGPQIMQMTSPIAPMPQQLLPPTPASDPNIGLGRSMIMSSHATDPRPRPSDIHGESAGADLSGGLAQAPSTTPWVPVDASQRRLESTSPSVLAGLLATRPSPSAYTSLVSHGAPWPPGDVAKGVPVPQVPPPTWHIPNARFVDENGAPYGAPGRPPQPPGNLPLPVGHGTALHGSLQLPANIPSPRSPPPPLNGGNILGENVPLPGLSGSHVSPRERRFSAPLQGFNTIPLLQPPAYILPPVPAGRPTTPHALSVPGNIPTRQQVHMHFQQQNIIKLQQQSRPQQLQQISHSQQMQHVQHHLLGPLPMSVQVPGPVPPLPPPPPPPPPPPSAQQLCQQQEASPMLQQMLASPDAIQALLKDQNKLRELLEQHPKLISLLQERMSQSPP